MNGAYKNQKWSRDVTMLLLGMVCRL